MNYYIHAHVQTRLADDGDEAFKDVDDDEGDGDQQLAGSGAAAAEPVQGGQNGSTGPQGESSWPKPGYYDMHKRCLSGTGCFRFALDVLLTRWHRCAVPLHVVLLLGDIVCVYNDHK